MNRVVMKISQTYPLAHSGEFLFGYEKMRVRYKWSLGDAPITSLIRFKIKGDRPERIFQELELSNSQLILPLNNEITRFSIRKLNSEIRKPIKREVRPLIKFSEKVCRSEINFSIFTIT